MQKLLTLVLIIALLITGGIVFFTQRYKVIGTSCDNALIFDSVNCSFIEKNAKGEWEEKGLKKGDMFMGFESEEKKGGTPSLTPPATTPESKPQPKPKPELKI